MIMIKIMNNIDDYIYIYIYMHINWHVYIFKHSGLNFSFFSFLTTSVKVNKSLNIAEWSSKVL